MNKIKKKSKIKFSFLMLGASFICIAIAAQVANPRHLTTSRKSANDILIERKNRERISPNLSTKIVSKREKNRRENILSLEEQRLVNKLEHSAIVDEIASDPYINKIRENLTNLNFKLDQNKLAEIVPRARSNAKKRIEQVISPSTR